MLIPDRAAFYLPPLLAFQHLRGAGDMVECVVVEDAEAHCRDYNVAFRQRTPCRVFEAGKGLHALVRAEDCGMFVLS
jgi:hypothetical protein